MAFSYDRSNRQQPEPDPFDIVMDRNKPFNERFRALCDLFKADSPKWPQVLSSLLNEWEKHKNLDDISLANRALYYYVCIDQSIKKNKIGPILTESFFNLLFASLSSKHFVYTFCDSNVFHPEDLCRLLQFGYSVGKQQGNIDLNLFE